MKKPSAKNKQDSKQNFVMLNEALKTPNAKCTAQKLNDKSLAITIPKREVAGKKEFLPALNVALMFGLREIGINNLDITFKEHQDDYVLIIET